MSNLKSLTVRPTEVQLATTEEQQRFAFALWWFIQTSISQTIKGKQLFAFSENGFCPTLIMQIKYY